MTSVTGWVLPPISRAFPIDQHDNLLKAAILKDEEKALLHAKSWLSENDLDAAQFREHRILIAVLARFSNKLSDHHTYPRLLGLQRLLWTRTLMMLNEAKPVLRAFAENDIPVMLIKGAARLADGGAGKSGRSAYDIDTLVHPHQMEAALNCLLQHDWTPSTGASEQRLRLELPDIRSLNLFKGNFGDIDLHSSAFRPGQGEASDNEGVWSRAAPIEMNGISALAPSREDRITMSIAHGGLDAHTHSDWLVDTAAMLNETISWDFLEELITRRSIETPSAIALSYLHSEMDYDIPQPLIYRLTKRAQARPLNYLSSFVQARPRDREKRVGSIMRGIAKLARRRREKHLRRKSVNSTHINVSKISKTAPVSQKKLVERFDMPISPDCRSAKQISINAEIQVPLFGVPRRLEFEINTPSSHIARFRHRVMNKSTDHVTLKISGDFFLPKGTTTIWLEARPSRGVKNLTDKNFAKRYQSPKFLALKCQLDPTRAQ